MFWKLLMSVLIAASVNLSDVAGMGYQNHLVGVTGDNQWWVFYQASSSTTTIKTASSPTGTTWTGQTSSNAFTAAQTQAGKNFGVAYKQISAKDVIHIDEASGAVNNFQTVHARATISGGAITWSAWGSVNSASAGGTAPVGVTPCLDSNNRPIATTDWGDTNSGDPWAYRATNTDSGTSWTAGWAAGNHFEVVTNDENGMTCFDTGGGNVLALWENAAGTEPSSMTNIRWSQWTGSWSAPANVYTSNFSAVDPDDFGAVDVATNDIHVVVRTGSNTYSHRRFNGSVWSAGDSIPTQTSSTLKGLVMITDNTSAWLVVTDATSILYTKWVSGTGWSAWTSAESPGQVVSLGGWNRVFNSTLGIIFGQTNGANTDLKFLGISVSSPIAVDEGDPMNYAFRTIW